MERRLPGRFLTKQIQNASSTGNQAGADPTRVANSTSAFASSGLHA